MAPTNLLFIYFVFIFFKDKTNVTQDALKFTAILLHQPHLSSPGILSNPPCLTSLFLRESCCVAQAGLRLPGSSKSSASASQVAGTTSVCFPASTWRCLVKHTQIPIVSQSRLHDFWVFVEPVLQGIRVYPTVRGFFCLLIAASF